MATGHHYIFSLVKNLEVKITNSDPDIENFILHEATLLSEVPKASMAAPRSRLDNMPTVLCSMSEDFAINPVVEELLWIRALHS